MAMQKIFRVSLMSVVLAVFVFSIASVWAEEEIRPAPKTVTMDKTSQVTYQLRDGSDVGHQISSKGGIILPHVYTASVSTTPATPVVTLHRRVKVVRDERESKREFKPGGCFNSEEMPSNKHFEETRDFDQDLYCPSKVINAGSGSNPALVTEGLRAVSGGFFTWFSGGFSRGVGRGDVVTVNDENTGNFDNEFQPKNSNTLDNKIGGDRGDKGPKGKGGCGHQDHGKKGHKCK